MAEPHPAHAPAPDNLAPPAEPRVRVTAVAVLLPNRQQWRRIISDMFARAYMTDFGRCSCELPCGYFDVYKRPPIDEWWETLCDRILGPQRGREVKRRDAR